MDFSTLTETLDSSRDNQWEQAFLAALPEAHVEVLSPDPQVGPDGWPYLMVATGPAAKEPIKNILDWLSLRGIGLVVNPQKEFPDYVFSYGMIWNYRQTGKLVSQINGVDLGTSDKIEFSKSDLQNAGTPSPEYLPDYARGILKEFFRDQGLLQPKILVMTRDGQNYELAFSTESLGNPPQQELAGIAEAISWFLPSHYSIVLVSEKDLPPFSDL